MNQPFNQSVTIKLDKAPFQQWFEQSAYVLEPKNYLKTGILGALVVSLFLIEA